MRRYLELGQPSAATLLIRYFRVVGTLRKGEWVRGQGLGMGLISDGCESGRSGRSNRLYEVSEHYLWDCSIRVMTGNDS